MVTVQVTQPAAVRAVERAVFRLDTASEVRLLPETAVSGREETVKDPEEEVVTEPP